MTPEEEKHDKEVKEHNDIIGKWAGNVFMFLEDAIGIRPAVPIDSLVGKKIKYTDADGNERETMLFDKFGNLVYHDLTFYSQDMFKNQTPELFRLYQGKRLTWQQTVTLTAYQRALMTFDKDSFDVTSRWISVVSGHGTGKTASLCFITLHFLICYYGSQIGVTANTEDQLKDIFLKEFYSWRAKLSPQLQQQVVLLDDMVRILNQKDWFLRARVSKPDKPEALAGLHGPYILLIVDEASGVPNKVFEVMGGSLTGPNYIVVYTSNGTRTEGEFFDSHKEGAPYTKLSYSSRHSPIVKKGFIESMETKYGKESDEVRIRVDGKFAYTGEMDVKGWIPLLANVNVMYEPERNQIIKFPVIALDPAGSGKDHSALGVRDDVYLKMVLYEKNSNEKDLARKVETVRDAYQATSNDIGIEAFGVGAKVVANVQVKLGETVNALLTDKPREGTEHLFNSWKSELAWKFREWLCAGGIIITNNPKEWARELEKIKYKRDSQGRIRLMTKVEFKKEYNFSPDKFDMAIHTFFKDHGTYPTILTKQELETTDLAQWLKGQPAMKQSAPTPKTYSSM